MDLNERIERTLLDKGFTPTRVSADVVKSGDMPTSIWRHPDTPVFINMEVEKGEWGFSNWTGWPDEKSDQDEIIERFALTVVAAKKRWFENHPSNGFQWAMEPNG